MVKLNKNFENQLKFNAEPIQMMASASKKVLESAEGLNFGALRRHLDDCGMWLGSGWVPGGR